MVLILNKETTKDKYPNYLMVANRNKIIKYNTSIFRFWKKYILEKNNIWLIQDDLEITDVIFYNNERKYNIIYKKMFIGKKIIYIPIEEYSKFYLDYKIKLSTSIVEMLGVFSIQYIYSKFTSKLISAESYAEYANAIGKNKVLNDLKNEVKNNDFKKYDKTDCPYLFLKINEFEKKLENLWKDEDLISFTDYKSDIDLQHLVRSRLIGNLTEYTLKYEIDFMNNFEIELTSKFYANFAINFKKIINEKLNVSLDILFFRNRDLINSVNIQINEDRCLQLILKGPSPQNYYEELWKNYIDRKQNIPMNNNVNQIESRQELNTIHKDEENIIPDSLNYSFIDKPNNTNIELLHVFIEKYIEKNYKQKNDTDDKNSIHSFYNFIKIADHRKLDEYISEVHTLEDLKEDGEFFLKLRSTAFAALITFDDIGFQKIQNIYLNIFRQNPLINKKNSLCYDFNCTHINCDSPCKKLKRIYIYIIRVYNHSSPSIILTVDFDINPDLTKILHNITLNIVIIPNFTIFQDYVKKEITRYISNQNTLLM